MQIGGGQFWKRISVPTLWYQNPCDASTSYMLDQILGKLNFQAKIWPLSKVVPSQNKRTCLKSF